MPSTVITARLPESLHAQAKVIATGAGKQIGTWAREVLEVAIVTGGAPAVPSHPATGTSGPSPEVRHAAMLLADLGRLADALRATPGDLAAEIAAEVRDASRSAVELIGRLR